MVRQFFLAVILSIIGLTASAQTEETTPNLINNNWTGVVPYSGTGGGSGGPNAGYNSSTNTIHFSYGQSTAATTFAINQALSGSGIQITGYNYSWEINNLNYDNRQGATDTLTARVLTYMPDNVTLRRQDSWTYNTKFDWTTFSGTVNYHTPGAPSDFGNLRVEFSSVDSGFWAGYYGPQVRNVDVRMRYGVTQVDPCISDPQSSPSCPGYKTYYNISDDSHAIVPIPFGFPFYGKLFTHSIFFDNGTVSFYTPNQEPQRWGAGATGGSISNNIGSQFYYSIMPLWTDLINYNGSHYTQGDANYLRYTWDNISQFGNPSSSNTFSLEIRPTGFIGIHYDQIDVSWATVGMIGNAALGEFNTFNSQTNWSVNETVATDCSNPLNNPVCPGYQQAYFDQQCSANTLYSPSCPGYQQAYFTQQCSINTLYDPACPGYATAYYDYQCSVSALYHTGCPGYATAYFNQQCSLNALYNESCPGYATAYFDQQCSQDPLYDQKCTGYDDAYYVQQCTASPLYDSGCDGYDAAYLSQQCSIDTLYNDQCPGYATAYFDQQCSLDSLYNNQCPGYAAAYFDQQCGINTLYNDQCPGYATAYFDQQCSLDTLYNNQCPGYETAYFNQQCGLDTLYNSQCPGYETAYFNQQCGISALYNDQCPGYGQAYFNQQCSLDSLYNENCTGYTDAFHNQQCSLNTLYSSTCPGYETAYFNQQCGLNTLYNNQCPGYETAYFNQQCSLNTLYDSACPGYATAYFDQQCSLNTLYDSACPGYATAYFDQQCANDALYNNQCPGYGEAYAKKFILVATPATETAVVAEPETVVVAQAEVVETKEVAATAAATEPAPAPTVSASPAAAATAPVSLVAAPAPAPAAAPAEKKAEAKTETTAAGGTASDSKSKPATTRQALAQRRLEAAREAAAESAKNNPGAVASQMDSAASMEQQVELQNVVLGAMGFVAGFDAYGRAVLPDAAGYKPFEIYSGQQNVDTPAARGLLGRSDRLHSEMVDSQYNK